MKLLRTHFITGLVTLLPLAVTIAIIGFIVNVLTEPFIGAISSVLKRWHIANQGILFLSQEQVVLYTSKLLILALLFAVTIFLGIVTRVLAIRAAFSLGDKVLHKIPVVNTVYKTSQDIIKTLFISDKNSFKQVVMVPFPSPGVYAIGLISRDSPQICSDTVDTDLVSVLIPTTPNPTTGFLLMFPRKDLILLDMKPEEAIKYVVSCGVVIPEAHQPLLKK